MGTAGLADARAENLTLDIPEYLFFQKLEAFQPEPKEDFIVDILLKVWHKMLLFLFFFKPLFDQIFTCVFASNFVRHLFGRSES